MNKFISTLALGIIFFTFSSAYARSEQTIAGAGPSTKIVQLFIESFKTLPEVKDIDFTVPPISSKHKGGITSSSHNLFGRTGRPLNDQERKSNKEEIILARVPVSIVVGKGTGINSLSLSQLENITNGSFTNWQDVGGPDEEIIFVGREQSEALFSVLKQDYDFFRSAQFKFTFQKDNHLIDFFKQNPAGRYAIAFGAQPNFTDISEVNIVQIDGFESGVSLGLVYDLKNSNDPVIRAAQKHAGDIEWKNKVIQAGLLPAK